MIDHVGISVSQYESSREFYKAALAALGYELIMEIESKAALEAGDKDNGAPGIRAQII